jgi:hypothetical protein
MGGGKDKDGNNGTSGRRSDFRHSSGESSRNARECSDGKKVIFSGGWFLGGGAQKAGRLRRKVPGLYGKGSLVLRGPLRASEVVRHCSKEGVVEVSVPMGVYCTYLV